MSPRDAALLFCAITMTACDVAIADTDLLAGDAAMVDGPTAGGDAPSTTPEVADASAAPSSHDAAAGAPVLDAAVLDVSSPDGGRACSSGRACTAACATFDGWESTYCACDGGRLKCNAQGGLPSCGAPPTNAGICLGRSGEPLCVESGASGCRMNVCDDHATLIGGFTCQTVCPIGVNVCGTACSAEGLAGCACVLGPRDTTRKSCGCVGVGAGAMWICD